MHRQTLPAMRRTSGRLLVTGFVCMVPGVAFAVANQTGSDDIPLDFAAVAGSVFLSATMLLTLAGLIAFDVVVRALGDRVIAGLGTAAYAIAAICWLVATGRALVQHSWSSHLEAGFIVAAGIALLAFGFAVVLTEAVPRWVGAFVILWSAGSLVLFALPSQGYPPLLVQLAPLSLGIAMLRSARTTARGAAAR